MPLALAGLVDRPFLATETWREQQRRANREGAHPKIVKFEAAVIRRFKKMGIPMFCHSMVRDAEAQAELFRLGVSRDSPADGIWPHKGCAVDIIHSVKGWQMNTDEWKIIGHTCKEVSDQLGLSMTWGGPDGPSDKFAWDPAHWELKNFKAIMGEYPWPTSI